MPDINEGSLAKFFIQKYPVALSDSSSYWKRAKTNEIPTEELDAMIGIDISLGKDDEVARSARDLKALRDSGLISKPTST